MDVQLGDPTLNALEIWGAEYQESNALLLRLPDRDFLSRVSARERCPVCFVGTITGDRRVSWLRELVTDAVRGLAQEGECLRKETRAWAPWGPAWGRGAQQEKPSGVDRAPLPGFPEVFIPCWWSLSRSLWAVSLWSTDSAGG